MPVYFGGDEAHFAAIGHSIATTGQPLPALIAALVLALAPVHVILSRQALDYILPVPFVLGWLWCLDGSLRAREGKHAALAGLILGVGFTATSRRGR